MRQGETGKHGGKPRLRALAGEQGECRRQQHDHARPGCKHHGSGEAAAQACALSREGVVKGDLVQENDDRKQAYHVAGVPVEQHGRHA